MIRPDLSDIRQFEKDLSAFASRALPFASRQAINKTAFDARADVQARIDDQLVQRNKFTRNSIRVEQTRSLRIENQRAVVGSIAPYFDDLEFGNVKTRTGKEGVPIATSYSAGQDGQQPRTKIPRKPNRMQNITLAARRRKPKHRRQANLFAVQDAVTTGKRVVFLDFGRTKGLFRVLGGRKRFKRGWPKGARIKMLWDMSRTTVRTPSHDLFSGMVREIEPTWATNYHEALTFQARRAGLFR